jgi:hypothetical protein
MRGAEDLLVARGGGLDGRHHDPAAGGGRVVAPALCDHAWGNPATWPR